MTKNPKKNNDSDKIEFLLKQIRDPMVRAQMTKKNHFLFFHIYLGTYVTCPMAPFHKEMFSITEDKENPLAVICAFRGSSKSTLLTLSYVLWSILGVQQKKFVVIVSQTQDQAKLHFKNLKRELENNKLLQADLGPFQEDEWNTGSLVIPKYGARIMAVSVDQKFRGIKHDSHRPDLIICDDVEDLNSVKTREGREKTYGWFNSEVVPLGDIGTKIIVVGNLLHKDSLIMRLKQEIEEGSRSGLYREYPLLDEKGNCLWSGKYPDEESIEKERLKVSNFAWNSEYLLNIIDNREAVVQKDWIKYYRDLPNDKGESYTIGIDLAISEKETADFTAMVCAKIIPQRNGSSLIYILPNPINERLSFPDILSRIETLANSFGGKRSTKIYVEEAFLQGYLTQFLEKHNFVAEGFKPGGMDKRSRLTMTTNYLQGGKIFFPEQGAKELINQLLNFGVEKHDDLVDAFTTLVLKIIESDNQPQPGIIMLGGGGGLMDGYDDFEKGHDPDNDVWNERLWHPL